MMDFKQAKVLAAYIVAGLGSLYLGVEYGGILWLPFVITVAPFALVALGYVVGRLSGPPEDVTGINDAVSKGLEKRRDTEPEDRNDE